MPTCDWKVEDVSYMTVWKTPLLDTWSWGRIMAAGMIITNRLTMVVSHTYLTRIMMKQGSNRSGAIHPWRSVWLQNLMKDIKITHNTQLYCDNQPAIKTVQLEVALEGTKHIRRRVDFVKQQIQFSPLLLQYVLRNWIVQTYLRRHYQIHSSQTYSTMCIRYKTYWPTINNIEVHLQGECWEPATVMYMRTI